MSDPFDAPAAAAAFALAAEPVVVGRYGNGLVNATFEVRSGDRRYVLQRLNEHVFPDPERVMRNVAGVLAHLQRKNHPALRLHATAGGAQWHVDGSGGHWRMYDLVEDAVTLDRVESADQAWQAAAAFGRFQSALRDYEGPLEPTIPDFHHTPRRLARLAHVAHEDPHGRLSAVRRDVEWALDQNRLAGALLAAGEAGAAEAAVTHNDTKVNNVLLAAGSGAALCVVDLDTVMPGLDLYDAGDLVRTASCPLPEDHPAPADMAPSPELLAAVVDGWCAGTGRTAGDLVPLAGAVITFEIAVRFLTDWLEGDRYFRVRSPEHNRVRGLAQLGLCRSLLALPSVSRCPW